MVAVRQDIRLVEEFEEYSFSGYTSDVPTTTVSTMGRTPGIGYTFGLSTQEHIDVRTFNASSSGGPLVAGVSEEWKVEQGSGTFTIGPQSGFNHWNGLIATVPSGLTSYSSRAGSLDLTQIDPASSIILALPNFPLASLTLSSCYLDLIDENDAQFSLPFSSSATTLIAGNSEASWTVASITGIDTTQIVKIRIRLQATGSCTVNLFALRAVGPNWVAKDVEFDNWNGALRQCIPPNGDITALPVPNNQLLPPVWYAAPTPGVDDPSPIDSTVAIVFNTGSQTAIDGFSMNLRAINGIDTSQLTLANEIQAQLNGPQPGLVQQTLEGRTLSDISSLDMSDLSAQDMEDLDSVGETVNQSWLSFQVNWGVTPSIAITRSSSATTDYQWIGGGLVFTGGGGTFANNTYYLMVATLSDTTARLQIYQLNQTTFGLGTLYFDSGIIEDSYRFVRRAGNIGWKASLQDGDASIRSIRPEETIFAEYLSFPLNSNTPVQGVRVYAQFAPKIQLWQDWTAVAGHGVTPGVTADSKRSTSGSSTRVDITTVASGQGILSNILTPSDDSVSGVVNWTYTEIDLNLWFPSAALNAGAGLNLYLLSQDGYTASLTLPRLIPDQWQAIKVYTPAMLQSGRYQLGLTYVGSVPASFWVDSIDVLERTILWTARANPGDPWLDLRDAIGSDAEGGTFTSRGTQLQVRAQAMRQDAVIIGAPKIVPVYAGLGNLVWPEEVVADPTTFHVPVAGAFTVSPGSPTHGVAATFTVGVCSEPLVGGNRANHAPGLMANWFWTFGDGTSTNGQIVQHTYAVAGTYQVSLAVTDYWGVVNTYTSSIAVS